MPVLEDTVDFKVATLNDLLDADVRTGVPVAADDKYKRWAFLSTGLAGMLLVGLILALVTGGGDDAGGTTSTDEVPKPPGTRALSVNAGSADLEGIVPGTKVTLYNDEDGQLIANGATVLKITETRSEVVKGATSKRVRVAVTEQEVQAVTQAQKVKIVEGESTVSPTATTAPASDAPTPIETTPTTAAG
jgi:hypothetical protein